jgi:AraC-type DNA-binding domain-containing proteins
MRMKPKQDGGSTRGILHATAAMSKFKLNRFEPCDRLRPFIEHYWIVRYHLPQGESYTQRVLTYPNIHMAFEHDEDGRRALIYGVPKRPFVRVLRGEGRVLGVKFRAGGFHPFWRDELARLTGRTMPATDLFGPVAAEWMNAVLDAGDAEAMALKAETFLLDHVPEPDEQAGLAARIVEQVMRNRSIVRVEQLREETGLSIRQLQRLFQRYVGVTPKWVIRRFRLQEAAERIERDGAVSLTDLALQLGYFDQAHFIKDFKAVLGQPPAAYRQEAISR